MKSVYRPSAAAAHQPPVGTAVAGPHPPPPPHMGPPPHNMPYPPMMPGAQMPYPPPPHYHHPAMYAMPPMPPLQGAAAGPAKAEATTKNSSNNNKSTTKEEKTADGESPTDGGAAGGLELLASLALPVGPSQKGGGDASSSSKKAAKKKARGDDLSPKEKLYVEKVRDCDVLCGRGGRSNHHGGNKRYRQVVSEMKRTYQSTGAKTAKTDLSRAIVEHVVGYGGRFIKREEETGKHYLLTKAQARRKTSQALRETKELKWTM